MPAPFESPRSTPTFPRRRLLQASGVGAAVLALGIKAPPQQASAAPLPAGDLFGLGVASGAPRADGMVLWTRLAPEPLAEDGHGGMPLSPAQVTWEVASDPAFQQVIKTGHALAQPELAHAVHPRVGGLEPASEYFYRFRAGNSISPVGRFRTLPGRNDQTTNFSFALTSCQAWYHGHFTAHRHLAAENDLDLVVMAGDYIYEYAITEANLWRQGVSVTPAHAVEVETLEQYRLRYALFKSDPHLMALHARTAVVATWDDHEVQNGYQGKTSSEGKSDDLIAHRVAVGYRAFYENLPLDIDSLPDGPDGDVTSGFDVGRLARFSLMDTRQFRDHKATSREDQFDPARTMLGKEQESWVTRRLQGSKATWNVLVSSVVLTAVTEDRREQWDGYPAARQRLLDAIGRRGNGVVLSGDIHHHVASELRADFSDPNSPNVGVELVCTSIGSNGDGVPTDGSAGDWEQHDWVKLYDARRGYLHVTMTPQQMTSTFVIVGWIEADDTAPREVRAQFVTPAGRPGLEPVGGSTS